MAAGYSKACQSCWDLFFQEQISGLQATLSLYIESRLKSLEVRVPVWLIALRSHLSGRGIVKPRCPGLQPQIDSKQLAVSDSMLASLLVLQITCYLTMEFIMFFSPHSKMREYIYFVHLLACLTKHSCLAFINGQLFNQPFSSSGWGKNNELHSYQPTVCILLKALHHVCTLSTVNARAAFTHSVNVQIVSVNCPVAQCLHFIYIYIYIYMIDGYFINPEGNYN